MSSEDMYRIPSRKSILSLPASIPDDDETTALIIPDENYGKVTSGTKRSSAKKRDPIYNDVIDTYETPSGRFKAVGADEDNDRI